MDVSTEAPSRPRDLTVRDYLGYAGGDAANNLTFMMASLFLLLYYTDVVGLSAAVAGAILLVVRVWQAVTDLVAGRVVDLTTTRWGRFRPYFLFCGAPLMLLGVALFSVPGRLSDGGAALYAMVSYAVFGLAYSFVNIPYGSVASAMTELPQERARLSSYRAVGQALATVILAFVVAPQIQSSPDLQRSFTTVMIAFGVVGLLLYVTLFRTVRETVPRDTTPVTLRQTLAAIGRNRPLLMLCLSAIFVLTGMFVLQTTQVYYARDVLGNANFTIALTVMTVLGQFAMVPVVPRLVARSGKKAAYIAAGVLTALGGVGIALSPPAAPVAAIVSFGVYGLGIAAIQALMWALEADTVEYGEWDAGVRTEGSNYAALSFTRKVGQGIGGGLAAWGLGVSGYVAGAATQRQESLIAIRYLTGFAPTIFVGLGAVVMLAYPLSEARFQQMLDDVVARRAARTRGAAPGDAAGEAPVG
ncbi:glycoside-pentoside-hexuronide (GPH):cation symporter [Georgenia ruanii]|uniref:glycoside-pentoside-hexuronide (GPH):cation symporter n=1 Tax=Georgenia ruanii TaxID=348442 RepID=UPI001265414A|nr:glycoside-pentoside-hexuronide (GPH):cation symporter [Georgenia ruanii]